MTNTLATTAMLALALASSPPATAAAPAAGCRWIAAWHASPQPAWDDGFILPTGLPASLGGQTTQEAVRLSAGGRRLRLVFSNRYGQAPVAIGAVRVALPGGDGADGAAWHALRFGGRRDAVIAPGAQLTSDPVELATAPLARLLVRTYFPQATRIGSFHWGAQQSIALGAGDQTGRPRFRGTATLHGRLFLSGVLVEAPRGATVVVLGDSITDGNGSTPDRDRRWPDLLARRLAPHGVAVANAGISGARLLRDGMGTSALARLDQDVLALPGAATLVVLLGTNDIGWPGSPFAPNESPATLAELAAGFTRLAERAHARGLRVLAATLPPFQRALEGTPYAGHYSEAKEALRQQLNGWIRNNAAGFDAVVDFDAVLRDPAHPRRLRPAYDSGDHLHPGDAGYQAMADAIDLSTLLPAAHTATEGRQP